MLTPFVLAADYAGTLDLAGLAEVRARSTSQAAQPLGVDFYVQPQLRTRVTDRRWEYTLSYLPSLTLPDFESGVGCTFIQSASGAPECSLLHVGSAGLAWHDRIVRVALAEDATYGQFNSAYLLSPAALGQSPGQAPIGAMGPPAIQPLAQPVSITLLTTRTAMTASARVDRRTSLSIDGAYTISGGFDIPSQNVLPQLRGPSADALIAFAVSRRDQLLTTAQGQWTDSSARTCLIPPNADPLPCSPQDRMVQLNEGLVHAIARSTSLAISAGGGFSWIRIDHQAPYDFEAFAEGALSLTHRFGERGRSTLQIGAQFAPAVDQLTGVITQRLQGQASVADRVSQVVTLRAGAYALHEFATTYSFAANMLGGEMELALLVSRRVLIAVGERGAWQIGSTAFGPGNTFFSSLTYFNVTVSAPTLRY